MFRAALRFKHVILRIHSVGYQIQRRYTTFREGSHEGAGYGDGKDHEGKEKLLTLPQKLGLLEKNMESATSDMKSTFKWAGGALIALFGGTFYFDNAMENRLVKRMDDQGTRFDKRLDGQEARLKEYVATGLHQLRLEVRNDRLNDQLSAKGKKVEV